MASRVMRAASSNALLLTIAIACSALAAQGASAAGGHQHHVHLRRLRLTPASLVAQQHHHSHHHRHHLGAPHRRHLQGNDTTFCAAQVAGAPAPFNTTADNKTMVTCLEFHNGTALIKVPADTATTKYGQIVGNGPFAVYDRDGKNYPIDASADPPTSADEVNQVWSHVVVEAKVSASTGAVTSFKPLIYVFDSALLREYVGSQYVATLTNEPPKGSSLPAGVSSTAWVRWSFLSNLTSNTSTALLGSFDNLYAAVQDGDVCRPALCADPKRASPACVYYSKLFSANVTLVWDARIFFPGVSGSQLGAFLALSAAAVTYVPTSLPPLYGFLKPYTFSPKQFVDFNVGNPFNLPFQFSGSLVNATSFEYC